MTVNKPENNSFPQYTGGEVKPYINSMYEWSLDKCRSQIDWYERNRRIKKGWSQGFRTWTIIITGLGVLCPLLENTGLVPSFISDFGYVFLALAGILLLYDKFFGYSSGWMRYMETLLVLQRELDVFQVEWNAMLVQVPEATTDVLFEKLRSFIFKIESLVIEETLEWIKEFKSNITKIESMTKQGS